MLKKHVAGLALLAAMSLLIACGGSDDSPDHPTHTAPNGDKINDADVEFATEMIQHHAQALAMVDLTRGRQLDPEVQELAEAILMAQGPEIEQMADWLTDWDQPIPETVRDHAHAHGDEDGEADTDMPGMMSAEEMRELEAAAQGAEFQEMWLEMMIDHHEGAIEMAEAEQAEGTFPPAVNLATDIESSQQDEIAVMEELLVP